MILPHEVQSNAKDSRRSSYLSVTLHLNLMNIFDHNFSGCQLLTSIKKGGRGRIRSLLYRDCCENGISQTFTYFNTVMKNTEAQATKSVAWSSDQGLRSMRYMNPKSASRIVKMKHLAACVCSEPCSFCAENETMAHARDGGGGDDG